MGMYDAIKNLNKQFGYEFKIENESKWKKFGRFILVGMGGSHLAADLVKAWRPSLPLFTHEDYGLPGISDIFQEGLVILSSYSGNTEEVLDAYDEARERGFESAAISVGGKLLARVKKDGAPYIQLPDTGIQPHSASGYMFKALLKIMGEENALDEVGELQDTFRPGDYEEAGKKLAGKIQGYIPLVYASTRNEGIVKNWRVRFHETAKIPSYYDVFPELNHNEMTGFDVVDATRPLSEKFYFIFLRDSEDHPRIQKRMDITERLYRDRGFPVETIEMGGKNRLERIFSSISLADWTSYYLGESYGVETEQVPMVEELKRLIA